MRVSVCVPVFNVEPYVERCARSLLGQTLEDMEFIFVDDCSSDASLSVVERVLADYPNRRDRVKMIRHAVNGGSARARKTAMENSTGEWIGFCDADDWVDPSYFETMLREGESSGADMVFAPMVRNENGSMTGIKGLRFSGSAADFLNARERIVAFHSTCNKLYRRAMAVAEDIVAPEPIGIGEDTCYMAQVVAKCRRVVSVTGVRYHYRVNMASKTRTFDAVKAVADLSRVYETWGSVGMSSVAPRLVGRLARNIAFYGLKFRVMSAREYEDWLERAERLLPGELYAGLPAKRVAYMFLGLKMFWLVRLLGALMPDASRKGL